MDPPRLNTLSVCTGLAGLDTGVSDVLPTRTVCYVEGDGFCIEHLASKAEAGLLDEAPIWTDLRSFDGRPWRGLVDLIVAGIPCQPHSDAGSGLGADDPRDLVGSFLRVVREVEPRFVIVENVRGFLAGDGLGRLLGGLADGGFDAEWSMFRACDVGAPHQRDRVFLVGWRRGRLAELGEWLESRVLADADAGRQQELGLEGAEREGEGRGVVDGRDPRHGHDFPPGPGSEEWPEYLRRNPGTEPGVRGGADGPPNRVYRLRALGNAVVPQQAAGAIQRLIERALRPLTQEGTE